MLAKVLASEGKKKLFFAHGTGQRKDGKGDGELVVRGKEPPKAESDGQLSELEGFCRGVCENRKIQLTSSISHEEDTTYQRNSRPTSVVPNSLATLLPVTELGLKQAR